PSNDTATTALYTPSYTTLFRSDVTIDDLIRGEVTWRKESLGDFILVRSDGLPTYNFCVVVDDHDMEITHVIRAEEHLTNTHRQRSEEHTSELQSPYDLVCRLLL